MDYYSISSLTIVISSFFLAIFVHLKGKEKSKYAFILFCLAVSFWSLGYFIWQISDTEEAALFWTRVLMLGAIFTSVTYFHFVVSFIKLKDKKKLLILSYFVSIIFVIFDFTDLFINRVEPALDFLYWPKPGVMFHPFLVVWFFFIIYSTYLLMRKYCISKGIKKVQIKYLLSSIPAGFIGGATNYFLWYDINIPPVGNILVLAFVLVSAYTITRYRFMDIKVVIRKGVIYGLFLFICLAIVLFGVVEFNNYLFSVSEINPNNIVLIEVVFLLFLFSILKKFLKQLIDKYINKDEIDFYKNVEEFNNDLNYSNYLVELINKANNFFIKEMKIEIVEFISRDFSKPNLCYFNPLKSITFEDAKTEKALLDCFSKENNIILKQEIPYMDNDDNLKRLYKFLEKKNMAGIIALKRSEFINGFIFISKKQNQEIYSKEDLDNIISISKNINIALARVLHYEEAVARVKRDFGVNNAK